MNISRQLLLIKQRQKSIIKNIYSQEFRMMLSAVYNKNIKWYGRQIRMIEVLNSFVENACMDMNPKRAFHYCIILDKSVRILTEKANTDFSEYFENKLF